MSQNAGTEAFAIATNLIRDDASDVSPGTTDPSGTARETRCVTREAMHHRPRVGDPLRVMAAAETSAAKLSLDRPRIHPASIPRPPTFAKIR